MPLEERHRVEILQAVRFLDGKGIRSTGRLVGFDQIFSAKNRPTLFVDTTVDEEVSDLANVREVSVVGADDIHAIDARRIDDLLECDLVVLEEHVHVFRTSHEHHGNDDAFELLLGESCVRRVSLVALELRDNHAGDRQNRVHSTVGVGTRPACSSTNRGHRAERVPDDADALLFDALEEWIAWLSTTGEHGVDDEGHIGDAIGSRFVKRVGR